MNTIQAAIVGFIFVCVIFPRIVKTRAQFVFAIVAVMIILFFDIFVVFTDSTSGFRTFVAFLDALLLFAAFVLLILATGGMSLQDWAGEFGGAFKAVSQGPDAHKPTIVPMTGEMPRSREPDEVPRSYTINDPPKPADSGIPLE